MWERVAKAGPDDCWEWNGSRNQHGYGIFHMGSRTDGTRATIGAHRAMFLVANGFLPAVVMHRCDNPPCCNPEHLSAGTQPDNVWDMQSKGRARSGNTAKTHCPQGHEYAGDNLYIEPKTGSRMCLTCRRARSAARNAMRPRLR